jgi:hypothetical protein
MKKVVLITLILGIMASGVWWQYHRSHRPQLANVVDYESDLTEQLLNGIFQELDQGEPLVYFVAFGQTPTDPHDTFLERFTNHVPPVLKFSSCVTPPNGMVIDARDGRLGVIVQIISIKPCSGGEFDVLVAFSNQPSKHDRFIYHLVNKDGGWQVLGRKSA